MDANNSVQLYKPTATSPYSSKLHRTACFKKQDANLIQLALQSQDTQPYWPASEAAQVIQSLPVSLYHPSFLLTTPLLHKEPMKDTYDAIEYNEYLYDAVPTAILKELKEQVINQPKYRSCPSAEEEHYIESPEVNRSTLCICLCTLPISIYKLLDILYFVQYLILPLCL